MSKDKIIAYYNKKENISDEIKDIFEKFDRWSNQTNKEMGLFKMSRMTCGVMIRQLIKATQESWLSLALSRTL
jgi:hypothetical protein